MQGQGSAGTAFLPSGAKPGFLWLQLCHIDIPVALCHGSPWVQRTDSLLRSVSGLLIAGKISSGQKTFPSATDGVFVVAFKAIIGNDVEGWMWLLCVEI